MRMLLCSLLLSPIATFASGEEAPTSFAEKCLQAHLYPEAIVSLNSLPPEQQKKERKLMAEALIGNGEPEKALLLLTSPPHTPEELQLYLLTVQKALQLQSKALIQKIAALIEDNKTDSAELLIHTFPYRDLSNGNQAPFLLLEAILDVKKGALDAANNKLRPLANDPLYKAEALFWLAESVDTGGKDPEEARKIRSELLALPENPYTAETFFRLYSWQEYLHGEKSALKHLKAFLKQFDHTPHAIVAYWLLGLNALQERTDPRGKKSHLSDPEEAISAFTKAEELHESLQKLPPYFDQIRTCASLEKIRLLLDIAKEATPAKKELYLTYAKESLSKLSYGDIDKRKFFFLQSELYDLMGDEKNAILSLQSIEGPLQTPLIHKKWAEFLFKDGQRQESLTRIDQILSQEKRLLPKEALFDLLFLKSQIHEDLRDYPKAILALSEIINEESAASLRRKAMELRGKLYEKLGRPELAKKQYEALDR